MTTAVEPVLFSAKRAAWVTPLVILLMMVLRLGLLGLGGWLLTNPPIWLSPFYQVVTYLLTLFLIVWERDRLSEFHIGWFAVGLILIFKPLQTFLLLVKPYTRTFPMAFPHIWAWIVILAALAMLIWLRAARPSFRPVSGAEKRWFGWGILAGVATVALIVVPLAYQLRFEGAYSGMPTSLLGSAILPFPREFLYQLGYAATSEEPLFRAFLWGYLLRLGWKDVWAWLLQALLFTLSHIYYIQIEPYSFWLIVPFGALVMGALAWRTRSISTSMAAHATMNALATPVASVVANWLFR